MLHLLPNVRSDNRESLILFLLIKEINILVVVGEAFRAVAKSVIEKSMRIAALAWESGLCGVCGARVYVWLDTSRARSSPSHLHRLHAGSRSRCTVAGCAESKKER